MEKQLQIHRSFHLHAPQKMKVVFKARASVCSCRIVQMYNLALCGPTAAWAFFTWNKLYYPFFVGPQYLRVRVWSGPVDCQWCSLAFLSLPGLRRKYNWEISRALSSSSKSFAYILCSHTNHQLSGLAVFVLEDCMAVAVSRLILAVTVKESRNFRFCVHITLIHLLFDSVNEIQWLKWLATEQRLWVNDLKNTDIKKKCSCRSWHTEWQCRLLNNCFHQSRFLMILKEWSQICRKLTLFVNPSSSDFTSIRERWIYGR